MNVTAEPCSDPAQIRALLRRQITSPVLWRKSMDKLFELGCTRYLEPAPGKQLTNMLKHTPCSQGFLTEQCRRRLDRQNDSAGGVDQIVVVNSPAPPAHF